MGGGFTKRTGKVMRSANREARGFKHEYIGTEHVLLGLLNDDSGIVAEILSGLKVDKETIRNDVEKVMLKGPDRVADIRLPLTPRIRKVYEYAVEEARTFVKGGRLADVDDLLIGLIRYGDGVAGMMLEKNGVTLDLLRSEIKRIQPRTNPRFRESRNRLIQFLSRIQSFWATRSF
jgi:ATP-dependent Clp protease ATP-binding subunit ClpC